MLKVGDKVRIKRGLHEGWMDKNGDYVDGRNNGGIEYIVDDMIRLEGEEYTVAEIYDTGIIELDDCFWSWTEQMLDKVESKMTFKVGDKVRIKENLPVGWIDENGNACDDFQVAKGCVNAHMASMGGTVDVISCAELDTYELEDDDMKWCWTAPMLEKVDETPTVKRKNDGKIKVGDKVKFKADVAAGEYYDKNGHEVLYIFDSMMADVKRTPICTVASISYDKNEIRVKENNWYWCIDVFEPYEEDELEEIEKEIFDEEDDDPCFKVGDKVRFKADVKPGKYYNKKGDFILYFYDGMMKEVNKGLVYTVKNVNDYEDGYGAIELEEEETGWSWCQGVFEKVSDAPIKEDEFYETYKEVWNSAIKRISETIVDVRFNEKNLEIVSKIAYLVKGLK